MRRSFKRLVVRSVLSAWLLGFAVVVLYANTRSWDEDRARRDGVFLLHRLIENVPPQAREARLTELRQHFSFEVALVDSSDVAKQLGRPLAAGEAVAHRASLRHSWYFLSLGEGGVALAAGPVNPAVPDDLLPVGVIVLVVALPLLAGLIAMRVEREIAKVEVASEALASGDLAARVGTDRDKGPSNELASNFNRMAERIEGLVRSRDELVQAVSHELGTPLARLRFQLAFLRDDGGADASRVAAIDGEVNALEELVAELLSYVQSDDAPFERQTFDPASSLADLAELAGLDGQRDGGAEVTVDVELANNGALNADPKLFQRAVENLLRNAMAYAKSRVLLKTHHEAGHFVVAVHDDGPGVPESLRDKVVAPFVRATADRDRRTGGVGLGLAIVSRILQRHDGSLEIGDSPLGGAVVTTHWPV